MKKRLLFCCMIALFIADTVYADKSSTTRIGNYILPKPLALALEEGVRIPIFVKFDNLVDKSHKIADAFLSLNNGHIELKNVSLIENQNSFSLSDDINQLLERANNLEFVDNKTITFNKNARLIFNISSFSLLLEINKDAFGTVTKVKQYDLEDSSVDTLSSILNYNFGFYQSHAKNNNSLSTNFLDLNLLTSKKEHHLDISASIYNGNKSIRQFDLYKFMYEKDFEGFRTSFGLLNNWSLQSSANVSGLPSSNIYAFSIGNNSQSQKKHKQYSLIPIIVFLSSPGEVRIYRQGKLLSIQNYPMGSFEIDTSTLPYGIYDVTVDTVVDGTITSSQVRTINKAFNTTEYGSTELIWEMYGGYMSLNNRYSLNQDNSSRDQTYLIGHSLAKSFTFLNGLNVQMSNYAFAEHLINETSLNLALNDNITLTWQTLLANHSDSRNIISGNIDMPKNIGSLWASYEKANISDNLAISSADNYLLGFSLSLNTISDKLGFFNFIYQKDRQYHNNATNYEYSNNLYNGKYATIGLRAGMQKNNYTYQRNITDRYVYFDFTIPFSSWMSVGVSSSNGNTKANISANKNFNHSFITNTGLTLSKSINKKDNNSLDISTYGYASYDSKYSSGMITVNRSYDGSINGNLTSKGSIAYYDFTLAASGKQGKSGIIIRSNQDSDTLMIAKVNQVPYTVKGDNTFIPLNAYEKYNVQLMNSASSLDSFDFLSEKNKTFTLYPGNVAVMKPKLKKIVTVFGRIKYQDGTTVNNVFIHNHIGKSKTNAHGEFALDIDSEFPVITLIDEEQHVLCETFLELKNAKGALWIGDVMCDENRIVKR